MICAPNNDMMARRCRWEFFAAGFCCAVLVTQLAGRDPEPPCAAVPDASLRVAPSSLPPLSLPSPAAAVALSVASPATPPVCVAAMEKLIATAPAVEWPPPCPLPADSPLLGPYMGPDGSQPISRVWCLAQRYEGSATLDWSAAVVAAFCDGMSAGTVAGTYDRETDARMDAAFSRLPAPVRGTVGMVLGSEKPWVECLALKHGAAEVWTFEYATVVSTHPQLKAKPTHVMAAEHITGALPLVDWAVSFSSLEHSGLGRYGDALNPDADKEAMMQAWCMLKPGGYMVLGVPMACAFSGYTVFNAHRVYGYRRLAYISAGFELAGYVDGCTHIEAGSNDLVVLRKVGLDAKPLTAEDFALAKNLPLR